MLWAFAAEAVAYKYISASSRSLKKILEVVEGKIRPSDVCAYPIFIFFPWYLLMSIVNKQVFF